MGTGDWCNIGLNVSISKAKFVRSISIHVQEEWIKEKLICDGDWLRRESVNDGSACFERSEERQRNDSGESPTRHGWSLFWKVGYHIRTTRKKWRSVPGASVTGVVVITSRGKMSPLALVQEARSGELSTR